MLDVGRASRTSNIQPPTSRRCASRSSVPPPILNREEYSVTTIGTVREIKNEEYRVGLTPEGAHALVDAGHRVLVETRAGEGIGCGDDAYRAAAATIA